MYGSEYSPEPVCVSLLDLGRKQVVRKLPSVPCINLVAAVDAAIFTEPERML